MSRNWRSLVAISLVLFAVSAVRADVVNVNFFYQWNDGPSVSVTGPAAIGEAGDQWNMVGVNNSGTAHALVNSKGDQADITFDFEVAGGHYNNSATENLFKEYWRPGGELYGNMMTFGGFAPDAVVDVYCYSGSASISGNGEPFEGPDGSGNILRGTNAGVTDSFVEGGNYVVFEGLTPDAEGEIVIDARYSWYPVNGFQLNVVPEPMTMLVIGLGAPLMLRRRK